MKAIQELISDVNTLEQQLECNIAKVAAELEPLPDDRDMAALEIAWGQATSSRRKLATRLRNGMLQIKVAKKTSPYKLTAAQKDARRELKAAKSRLRLWGRIESVVWAQMLSERRELNTIKEVQVMDQVVELFLLSMHRIANPTANTQEADAENQGCHQDIPYRMSFFSNMIGAAHRICLALQKQSPLRFLDVGSGGGTKVLAATTVFDLCDGLEYEKSTVTTGRRLFELLEIEQCKLIHGDALEFSNYQDYDVIYFYRPMKESDQMVEMEERIISQARPGTVLLTAGDLHIDDPRSKGVQRLTFNIYITGMSEQQAYEIFKLAEYMGQMVPGFRPRKLAKPAYWAPLIEASARNGYFL